MLRTYPIPKITYALSNIGYAAGLISQNFLSVPRPIRWHLASIAGAYSITCITNHVITAERPSDLVSIDDKEYRKNRIVLAGMATEGLIACREKHDQVTTGHGKFDYIDMWGGTAAIVCAIAAYKLAHLAEKAKRPRQASVSTLSSEPGC